MTDIADYSDKYSDQYLSQSFETSLVRIRRRQVLASLSKYDHNHILEIGCGLEPLFPFCDGFQTYTVVEPSEVFVRHARSLVAEGRDIEIIHDYFERAHDRLTAGPGFDFIILSSLLHEVERPVELLQAVRRLCGESTVVHINVPNVFSFHRLLAMEMGLINDVFEKSGTEIKFQRQTRFDKSLLFEMVEGNGFRVISSGTYFIKPFTHEQMEKILDNGILDVSVIEGLERMIKYIPDLGCEIFVDVMMDQPI
ncbi:MAG TPA: class I SAM-dependent methyltransferase [Blastocatellia bacterium]|nr:class I SAM-dependent methyltransferase [Blastocatellia bacterium]